MMTLRPKAVAPPEGPLPALELRGVHHTARPTWNVEATVGFYREVLGLKVCHAISARGWGQDDHPDFLHFFFESGAGSTIAFFYYLGSERPSDPLAWDHWLYRSAHTAWHVESREVLLQWKARLEAFGYEVMQVRHEILESIYVTDPNGYMVEFSWQLRPLTPWDALDANLTLNAAIACERAGGGKVESIEDIWRAKAKLIDGIQDA
jgi:catechol 2,3-dioxygenase-like lactoylglutathione lyase family enzyme